MARLVALHRVDIVLLAEPSPASGKVLEALNRGGVAFHFNQGYCERVAIYSVFPDERLTPIQESTHLTARRLRTPNGGDVLLAGLHRKTAAKGARVVAGTSRPYFYNPMWSLLGDASPGPPGTFHRARGEHVTFFWHMLDQVLLRPDLLGAFRNQDLEILVSDGQQSFLSSSGTPNPRVASDHLPLLFRLDI